MNVSAPRRLAIDFARGFALMGMMIEHLVPTEGATTSLGRVVTMVSEWFAGKSASLFFVLVGMSLAIQMGESRFERSYFIFIVRRAFALILLGVILHLTLWPTEVLMAIGCALPLAALIRAGGKWMIGGVAVALILLIPVLSPVGHAWMAHDWNDSGEPILSTSSALKLIFVDGCYPLMPWLVFILLGILAVDLKLKKTIGLVVSASLALPTGLLVLWLHPAASSVFAIEWVPTSIPFLFICGGVAFAVVFGLEAWEGKFQKFKLASWHAAIGRTSLSHYVGHILLVVLPLRHWYPAEEWPTRIGVLTLAGYLVFAVCFSEFWLRRFKRGPVEWLVSLISGSERRSFAG